MNFAEAPVLNPNAAIASVEVIPAALTDAESLIPVVVGERLREANAFKKSLKRKSFDRSDGILQEDVVSADLFITKLQAAQSMASVQRVIAQAIVDLLNPRLLSIEQNQTLMQGNLVQLQGTVAQMQAVQVQMMQSLAKQSNSSALSPRHHITRVPNDAAILPPHPFYPATRGALDTLSSAQCTTLLTFYDLQVAQGLQQKRADLSAYLGLRELLTMAAS